MHPTRRLARTKKVDSLRDGGTGVGAMPVLDDAAHPPTAFSTELPGGIQLLQLPDRSHSVGSSTGN